MAQWQGQGSVERILRIPSLLNLQLTHHVSFWAWRSINTCNALQQTTETQAAFNGLSFFFLPEMTYKTFHTYRLSRGTRCTSGAQQSPWTLKDKKFLLTTAWLLLNKEQVWVSNVMGSKKDKGMASWGLGEKETRKEGKKITNNKLSWRLPDVWIEHQWKDKLWYSQFCCYFRESYRTLVQYLPLRFHHCFDVKIWPEL